MFTRKELQDIRSKAVNATAQEKQLPPKPDSQELGYVNWVRGCLRLADAADYLDGLIARSEVKASQDLLRGVKSEIIQFLEVIKRQRGLLPTIKVSIQHKLDWLNEKPMGKQ